MKDNELKKMVEDKVIECYAKIERLLYKDKSLWILDPADLFIPDIRFDLKGVCAGVFHAAFINRSRVDSSKCYLNFNMTLLRENVDDFIKQTVPHEVAHAVCGALFATASYGKPHGHCWKNVMRWLGADPERCHDYNVKNARAYNKTKYLWGCRCGCHVVGPVKHKKMFASQTLFKQFRYRCSRCKNPVEYIRSLGKIAMEDAIEIAGREEKKQWR